jgi:uncharacterized membrane protein YgcG
MRRSAILSSLSVFALVVLVFTPAHGQFPGGGRKGGFGGGGMPFGGGGGGSFGGGGSPFSGGNSDPNRIFDMLARGRPYFLVTETQRLREPLTQYLKERGVSNGQVTRELFSQFNEQQMKAMSGGSGPRPGGFSPPTGFSVPGASGAPGGFSPPGGTMTFAPGGMSGFDPGRERRGGQFDSMSRWADDEFNRRDSNGDGVLNSDEMPDAIKNDLIRYDTTHDQLIDREEYRGYFLARLQNGDGRGGMGNPVTIILEEEFDRRPTVLRAGKLPKELKWFEEMDTDGDGQVAMYEWRKGGKSMDSYASYDRNEDGFITPEEALRMTTARNSAGDDDGDGERRSFGNGFGRGNGENRGGFGGGQFGNGQFGGGGGGEDFRAKMFGGGKTGSPFGGNPFGGKKGKKGG